MKRFFAIVLLAAIPVLLYGCTKETSASAEIANPIVEVKDASAFDELGLHIDAPEGAADVSYGILNNEIAQVNFKLNGVSYAYRAGKTKQDISGVYDVFDDTQENINAAGEGWSATINVKTVKDGDGALAVWQFDPAQFSLYTADKVDAGTIGNVASALAEQAYPFFNNAE